MLYLALLLKLYCAPIGKDFNMLKLAHYLEDNKDIGQIITSDTGASNSLIWGQPLNSGVQNLAQKKLHSISKKFPPLNSLYLCQIVTGFATFFHCWKSYEICYKTHTTLPISP